MSGAWIQTYSGVAFDLEHPTVDMVRPEDVAHALGNICRFTGHSSRLYTVADHSIHLARYFLYDEIRRCRLFATTRTRHTTGSVVLRALALQALCHDAHEAYYGDMSSPLKSLLPSYRALEARGASVVRRALWVPEDVHPLVVEADHRILLNEKDTFMGPAPRGWDDRGLRPLPIRPLRCSDNPAAEWAALYGELRTACDHSMSVNKDRS